MSQRVSPIYVGDLFFFLIQFNDYLTHIETNQSVGGAKREYPRKNHLTHPQAELGLSFLFKRMYMYRVLEKC